MGVAFGKGSQHVMMVAGRGDRILFWHNLWCGETPLKTLFPVLFSCSSNKTASIKSLLSRPGVGEVRVWNLAFIRDFNDWELDELLNFFNLIHSKIPREERPNAMSWTLQQHGRFDAKSFYHALSGQSASTFPWKAIWRVKAPKRVAFFVWTAAWGKILTCDNFIRRGYTMAGWCCMCRSGWETGEHLLIHCALASKLWYAVLRSFGVCWVFPNRIVDLLFGWYNSCGKHVSAVWNLVPLCLMWTVWRERNRRTFEDVELSTIKLIELFFGLLFDWAWVWGLTSMLSLADFVASLSFYCIRNSTTV